MNNIRFKIILVLSVFSLLYNCREQKKDVDKQKDTSVTVSTLSISQRSMHYDSLLAQLLELQNLLLQNPEDTHYIKLILNTSFDSLSNRFFCAGKGVANAGQSTSVQAQGMRRAAQHTAERWALYLKAWQENTMVPFGVEISGTLMSGTTVLFEKNSGDTLYLLLSVPSEKVMVL